MRCDYQLADYQSLAESAQAVLYTDKIPDETIREATFKLGKAYVELDKPEEALELFRLVSQDVKTAEGAEAKYQIAQILFDQNKVAEAEKEVLAFLDKNTTHQYWLARAYILWSDIYLTKEDLFQARATLQILQENYERTDDGILSMVNERLSKIQDIEN